MTGRHDGELQQAETPVAVVDPARSRANARKVVAYCRRHDLRWRPHVKTHKSVRIARMQIGAGARGLTVATPREAEVMSAVSDDLLLAYPPVGERRIARLLELPASVELTVALDTPEALEPLARGAASAGRTVAVLVEVDAGLRRVGVEDPAGAVDLARRASRLEGVEYRGLMFYPGHIRLPGPGQDESLHQLSQRLEAVYEALDAAGLPAEEVSGGSTPTLWRSHEIPGLTEVRAGTCIFHDRDTVALGVAEPEELAYSVLTTVVSDAVSGQVVVDAGSKALAKEPSRPDGKGGFGMLLDRPARTVTRLSEEHGIVDLSSTRWRPRVGDRLRVVPNHVCVSVNLQDRLLGLENGTVERIDLEGRGRVPAGG